MSKKIIVEATEGAVDDQNAVRSYPAPWKGQLVLVCRECQKRLKHGPEHKGLAKLNKMLKKRAHEDGLGLHVVDVSCLKLCPKGGVTVCTPWQLERNECSIVRSRADLDSLLKIM